MWITAISTMKAAKDTTTLRIETSEVLNLEQMGVTEPIRLTRGDNSVNVGRGVFKLVSSNSVAVAPATPDPGVVVLTKEQSLMARTRKDGDWPDPSALNVSADEAEEVKTFFATLSQSV